MTPLRQRMLEDLQIRHYSPITIRIYLHAVTEFARHFRTAPDRLRAEHIRQYQLFLIKEKKASLSTLIQTVCALRFFYTHTLHRKIPIERIPFPRRHAGFGTISGLAGQLNGFPPLIPMRQLQVGLKYTF